MRYKIISFMIVALMTISVISVSATENSIQIKVADVCDEITSTTTQVPVLIENNTGFASFTIIISYDNSKLKPIAVTKGSILNGTFISNLTYSSNSVRLVYASSDNTVENGAAFFIEFQLLSSKAIKTDININVEFLGDADFAYPNFNTENGSIEIAEKGISFECYFTEVNSNNGTYDVKLGWKNKSGKTYDDVSLYVAAYDANGRMVDIKSDKHSFYPAETYEIPWEFQSKVAVERINIFTWKANMQPLISATEKNLYEVSIEKLTLNSKDESTNYQILLSSEEPMEDETEVLVVEYADDGRLLGLQSKPYTTDEYITGNLLYDDTATVKCLVWKQSNMQQKALYKEVSVR